MKNLQLLFGSQLQQTIFKNLWACPMEWACIEDSTRNSQVVEVYTSISNLEIKMLNHYRQDLRNDKHYGNMETQ